MSRQSIYTWGGASLALLLCFIGAPLKALITPSTAITVEELARKGNGSYCVAAVIQPGTPSNYIEVPTGTIDREGNPKLQRVQIQKESGTNVIELSKSSTYVEEVAGSSRCRDLTAPPVAPPEGSKPKVGYCRSQLSQGIYLIEGGGTSYFLRPLTKDEYIKPDC